MTGEGGKSYSCLPVMVTVSPWDPEEGDTLVTAGVASADHSKPHPVVESASKSPLHLDGTLLIHTCTWFIKNIF